jgi:hypothetical protein
MEAGPLNVSSGVPLPDQAPLCCAILAEEFHGDFAGRLERFAAREYVSVRVVESGDIFSVADCNAGFPGASLRGAPRPVDWMWLEVYGASLKHPLSTIH